jgi:membrane protease YdiL (CAAX protease family)
MIRAAIVDDQKLMRDGLTAIINSSEDIRVVAEGADGGEAVEIAEKYNPDIFLMDVRMPKVNGIEATNIIKKLYPNSTVKLFYKEAFSKKLNIRLLVITTIIQIAVFASSVYMVSIQRSVTTIGLFDFSFSTIISALFFTLIQGATGEESGLRGYLLPAVEEKYGVVKGSLIVSLIWSFWHAPVWFLNTGYTGTDLIKYIIAFVICITSLGFIIGICYHHCKNLFVPIWIHFLFNFLGETFIGSMVDLVAWYAAFYFIIAVGFLLWHKKNPIVSKMLHSWMGG